MTQSSSATEIHDERRNDLPLLDTDYVVPEGEIENLHAHGWARLPGLLDTSVVTELRERLAAEPLRPLDALGKSYRRASGDTSADTEEQPVKFLDHELDSKHNQNHEGMAWRNDFFRRVGTSRRISGAAVQLMRREQAAFIQDISFFKPGGGGSPTAMHQDYASWPFDRKGAITIWIALVDVAENMGPLAYLEDSHLEGPLGLAGKLDVRATYPHLQDAKVVAGKALKAGDAQVHWDLTVHGAGPNESDIVREAYLTRFTGTDVIYNGIGHPHYDTLGLQIGQALGENASFPLVGRNGEISRESR
ncbi:hypothetical protein ABH922_005456 [Rhodococcus sp. 27YEA15]|uniref:phytanoyl-CoA dioxygenase family protein n=1 Tax=Rhodococcus sp. 27YEA15 TaxID=3156259 RepID=UPI003C7976E4